MILAVDPGKTTGIYAFKDDGTEYNPPMKLQLSMKDLENYLMLIAEPITVIVYEDYQVLPHMAKHHAGSKVEAAQVIGMLRLFASIKKIHLVPQRASILPIAEKLTQVKMPKNHAQSHWVSAYLHGSYYLIKQGKMKTALEKEIGNV